MSKKRGKGRIGAKVFAAVLAAALAFSNVSTVLPGGTTLAVEETLTQTVSDVTTTTETVDGAAPKAAGAEASAVASDSSATTTTETASDLGEEADKAAALAIESEAVSPFAATVYV